MASHIALKIEDFVPNIYFVPDEGLSRKITFSDDSILDNMIAAVKKLNLEPKSDWKAKDELYEELLTEARESDEFYLDEFADIESEDIEFYVSDLFNAMLKNASELEDEYKDVKMSEEARKEISKNRSNDILASILESLYLKLIAKTVMAAAELGIGEIHLVDNHKNARLAEKMQKELDRLGIELVID